MQALRFAEFVVEAKNVDHWFGAADEDVQVLDVGCLQLAEKDGGDARFEAWFEDEVFAEVVMFRAVGLRVVADKNNRFGSQTGNGGFNPPNQRSGVTCDGAEGRFGPVEARGNCEISVAQVSMLQEISACWFWTGRQADGLVRDRDRGPAIVEGGNGDRIVDGQKEYQVFQSQERAFRGGNHGGILSG